MSRLVPLSVWAEREYGKRPDLRTLVRWGQSGKIQPPPEKHGGRWYVEPDARYQAVPAARTWSSTVASKPIPRGRLAGRYSMP